MMTRPNRLRIGLALGSGAARGWSHIGVIRVLEEAGIRPDIVCGTSIGALVGGVYAADKLGELETWLRSLSWSDVVGFLDISMGGGLIKGSRLVGFLGDRLGESDIADFRLPFAAIATDLHTGREVWLEKGPFLEVARASISVPGLFTPVLRDGRYLVDGGLVNPVPVSLARAMGADIVIAVDLGADMIGRHDVSHSASTAAVPPEPGDGLMGRLQAGFVSLFSGSGSDPAMPPPPSMIDVLTTSINIMQIRITRSRLAGEPADAVIAPRLAHFALLDFHRAAEAIDEGRRAAESILPQIQALLGPAQPPESDHPTAQPQAAR
ncbi:MAG: patatin-like phospholipase RssA [Burkholderiaceae bacterium]|jgi:NTE family protein|nr:patatin-like phospholipase RssA [Burkholderiaceae bacterium]